MLLKTSGIIIKTTKYSDSSIIVKIYTRKLGLQSYIINGVRSKKSKNKSALFQALSVVDIEVLHSEKRTLQRITEINFSKHFNQIYLDIIKSSIVIFINELLYKVLKEEHPDEELFDFITSSIELLDNSTENCSNFPIFFMVELTKYLGFYPQNNYSNTNCYFDLQEGYFISNEPNRPYFVGNEISVFLNEIFNSSFLNFYSIKLNNSVRKKIVTALLEFYALHIHAFNEMKSHKVLEEIIN